MSAKSEIEKEALNIVADGIDQYADSIYVDAYGETRGKERDSHIKEHFAGLATYLRDSANE